METQTKNEVVPRQLLNFLKFRRENRNNSVEIGACAASYLDAAKNASTSEIAAINYIYAAYLYKKINREDKSKMSIKLAHTHISQILRLD